MPINKLPTESKVNEFVSKLLHARIQTHIFHWQVQKYSSHMALDDFYKQISDLTDTLVESYQGTYSVIKRPQSIIINYKLDEFVNADNANISDYLNDLLTYIDQNRISIFNDSDLLNIVDEIKTLIKQTLYKLNNLN